MVEVLEEIRSLIPTWANCVALQQDLYSRLWLFGVCGSCICGLVIGWGFPTMPVLGRILIREMPRYHGLGKGGEGGVLDLVYIHAAHIPSVTADVIGEETRIEPNPKPMPSKPLSRYFQLTARTCRELTCYNKLGSYLIISGLHVGGSVTRCYRLAYWVSCSRGQCQC